MSVDSVSPTTSSTSSSSSSSQIHTSDVYNSDDGSTVQKITGMNSGLDTDSIVKKLMKVEQQKVDELIQQKQMLQWKQDDYRSIIDDLNTFMNTYMNETAPETNMMSANNYLTYSVTTGTGSDGSDAYITATANSDASVGTINIGSITSVATQEKMTGKAGISQQLIGNSISAPVDMSGKSFCLTVDGVTKTITFGAGSSYNTVDALQSGLQGLVNNAFGSGRVTVSNAGGKLELSATNSTVVVSRPTADGAVNALDSLGFTSGQANRMSLYTPLGALNLSTPLRFGDDGNINFKINGTSFSFSPSNSMNDVMNTINNSDAGVTMSYSSMNDQFTLTAKDTGAGDNIKITDISGSLFGNAASPSVINIPAVVTSDDPSTGFHAGTNAVLKINGQDITRSNNTFTIDGISYTVKKADAVSQNSNWSTTLNVNEDTDTAFKNIKAFVGAYNDMIKKINDMAGEKKYNGYKPLTDDQKAQMKDSDITAWQDKSKSGILKDDPTIQNIVYKMRDAMYESVEGAGLTLSSIGITTGNYLNEGKLFINEDKLKSALKTNGKQITQLFSKQSDITYSRDMTEDQKTARYKSEGLTERLSDIINDNTSIYMDKNGNKGILLQLAGKTDDTSDLTNQLTKQMNEMDDTIKAQKELFNAKQSRYWKEFDALETAMQSMNQQAAWLQQQLSNG